ncbi:TetR/AcrR family transcriptional regulator [Aeromicrobium chenweiae]|uniref:TetR/AcrR family transcriptional regulator n=2 Tax=Aeromicrobium chenweiae TaxID=2079793 RepID=A0A2S0WSB3_9ACTN|nr:TetR/AcrR family transcriptional regulator [Aeromicrobium chenweiae]TGN34561.1 TetR/AcrR family transcriptional regulator [Aeromicrobium chenweiae]
MPAAGARAKSDERRQAVVVAAVECFAHKGFYGTATHEIAQRVNISQPYLYRLYPNKEALFASAVDHVSDVMTRTLIGHAEDPGSGGAQEAARTAYAALISDRTILRFLMHANCAAEEPLVGDAVRRCYAKQVDTVHTLLGGDDAAVRAWFGAGMVDNVAIVLGLADIDQPWARVLSGR